MKKIILSSFVLLAVCSCKKKAENAETDAENKDSTINVTAKPTSKPLRVITLSQTADFLRKKNDTLYVTNFFATWCGPCVKEIPHFKKKIEELKNQPVKITFVSLDQKEDWNTKVQSFTQEMGIQNHTVLLDGQSLYQNFFTSNFNEWTGSAIPFTFMRKGSQTDETLGMISEEQLDEKIAKLK